jgi:SAM-dependent methyltransferase
MTFLMSAAGPISAHAGPPEGAGGKGQGHDLAPGHDHDAGHHAHPAGGHQFPGGHHGNPADIEGYIHRLEEPGRADWQKPDEVIQRLGLKPGQVVCDIGAGSGYFALRLGRVLGPKGHVWAVDVEPRMLAVLGERIAVAGARNVTPVLGLPGDPLLPPASCDLVLVVNTYHHFPDGVLYLRRLGEALRPGGRLVNIDFHKRETPFGPPLEHRIAREEFLRQAQTAGLMLVDEPTLLPYQYFVILRPGTPAR